MSHAYWGPDVSDYPYGAVKTIQLQQGTNPKLVDRTLTYDGAGNRTQIADNVNSETLNYEYDHRDRLTGVSTQGGGFSESFAYNTIGNMTRKAGNSLTYGDRAYAFSTG